MRVLVLEGHQNQAVACVRSLTRAGHSVCVGETSPWSKAGWSRYCRAQFRYPSPEQEPENFVARIAEEARKQPGTLVLPMTESTTVGLSSYRDVLYAASAVLILPSHEDLLRAFDKSCTTQLARSLRVAVPSTTLVTSAQQARELAGSLPYPVVLKPRTSYETVGDGQVHSTGRPDYARNAVEFAVAYEAISRRCSAVLVQEFVEGEGTGYFALMNHGELRAEFAHRRIRDVHPTGSGSSLRVSVPPDPRVRAASLAILRALNWHGVAMVEFRLRRDGAPVFLEVNGRLWNSLALACHAGVDFPALLAQMAGDGDVEIAPAYRTRVCCRWLLGDFRHLLAVLRGAPKRYPGNFPGRIRTLRSFLVPVPGSFHDNFEWRDPLPELGDWLYYGHRAVGRLLVTATRTHIERRYSQS